jgi:hypothetical protein
VAGKLVQRSWHDNAGNKRQTVEIQVTQVGPDLQFATAEHQVHRRGFEVVLGRSFGVLRRAEIECVTGFARETPPALSRRRWLVLAIKSGTLGKQP